MPAVVDLRGFDARSDQLAAIKRSALGNFIFQYGQDLSIDQGIKENHQLWLRHQIVWQ